MINRKLVKFLSFRYVILALIFIILAGGLVLIPKFEKQEGITPEELLSNIISPERYMTTDELAERIINQDPSLLLIDLRDEKTFKKYTLPNAINIPLKNLFNEDSAAFINQDEFDVIFYSNDNFDADQAWILCNRLGYKNLRVLKGGINTWFKTIINPPKPKEHMQNKAFELYSFRKAASMYFGVVYPDQVKTNTPKPIQTAPKKVIPVKKKKKMPVEGGC
ncbi:rhodanese-like domain-containing protein [Flavivirga spongiicola]|uniref:Rhodanese-like domain-containing protein n=1 Tax=Flavivirga spongiicola TaxID=421621 RepID=A0ABU7Y1A7_9FLAO|nr:rhodanese-like domain-containing protein [Flavivirga sp. MEBiC05379]MDO5981046.1 rhodanese-like domain-containing protein [Flavivirga sp. MEBiC05379]